MTEMVINFITQNGYWGVFVLMVAENLFPPIPSEVILPFVGHSVAKGELNFFLALLTASVGAFIGTFFWFAVGWLAPAVKLEKFFRKYGGYVAISGKDFHKATSFFVKFEVPAVFFGRMIPGVRSVISIPAGSVRMNFKKFLLYSLAGLLIWNTLLISIGYFALSDYEIVDTYMKPVGDAIIYLFILVYVIQVIRFVLDKEGRS
ncbi:DedA family protein [Patescibacteria group bacterium]|nr:DedA family protein [Patescibacteria group bacterium]